MRIAGIDPGISGACAIIQTPSIPYGESYPDSAQTVLDVCDIPTLGEATQREIDDLALIRWLKEFKPDHLYLELVNAMPSIPGIDKDGNKTERRGMGAASAFKFGFAAGQIRTCIRGCKVPFTLVTPGKWKRLMGLKGSDKEPSRQLAIRLFPDAHDALKRKKDTNRAEALLLARYGILHGDHARAA